MNGHVISRAYVRHMDLCLSRSAERGSFFPDMHVSRLAPCMALLAFLENRTGQRVYPNRCFHVMPDAADSFPLDICT